MKKSRIFPGLRTDAVCSGLCTQRDWKIISCNKACTVFFTGKDAGAGKRQAADITGEPLLRLFQSLGFEGEEEGGGHPKYGCINLVSNARSVAFAWADVRRGERLFLFHEIPGIALAIDAERQHRLLTKELEVIIDSMHDGIWVIDGNGMTVHVNKAMKRMANIDPVEMIGKHVTFPISEGIFSSAVTLAALKQKKVVTMFDDYACGTRCLNTSTPIFDDQGEIWRVVASIRDMTELESLQRRLAEAEMEAHAYKRQLANIHQKAAPGFITSSKVIRQCVRGLEKVAKVPSGVLILGETGTGKTLAASLIHQISPRANAPFITVNCAAIPQSLIESELFGYEKGAFTGAERSGKKGFFELADKGTLLLDEIGELPLTMQAKLLHVLDNQTFHKIGSEKSIKVDVRIIAATNRPLEQLVSAGEFRADLYYRLRVLSVVIPPLREHPEDIPELAVAFLEEACTRHGAFKAFSPKVLQCFKAHTWPGNVRELRAAVEFLAAMTEGSIIRLTDVPPHILGGNVDNSMPNVDESTCIGIRDAVKNLEKTMIRNALAQTGSTYKAARLLGISQSSVVRKSRKLGIAVME